MLTSIEALNLHFVAEEIYLYFWQILGNLTQHFKTLNFACQEIAFSVTRPEGFCQKAGLEFFSSSNMKKIL